MPDHNINASIRDLRELKRQVEDEILERLRMLQKHGVSVERVDILHDHTIGERRGICAVTVHVEL